MRHVGGQRVVPGSGDRAVSASRIPAATEDVTAANRIVGKSVSRARGSAIPLPDRQRHLRLVDRRQHGRIVVDADMIGKGGGGGSGGGIGRRRHDCRLRLFVLRCNITKSHAGTKPRVASHAKRGGTSRHRPSFACFVAADQAAVSSGKILAGFDPHSA